MNEQNFIGVDIGGTNIRSGKVFQQEIISTKKIGTPSKGSVEEVINAIFSVIDPIIDQSTASIGVGVPSVVNVEKGIVYDVTNIPSWKEVPLKDILTDRYHLPVFINNDANCFAVGEKYFGKAISYNQIVGVTLGTGLGCGLIFNGKLFEGVNCGAGEMGNVPYLKHNIEYYCSGQFFKDEKGVDARDLYIDAEKGDKNAIQIFEEFGSHLGEAIKIILYAYDPEIIILGGSVTKSFKLFQSSMYDSVSKFAFRNVLKNLKIEVSALADSAIYGAVALHFNQTN